MRVLIIDENPFDEKASPYIRELEQAVKECDATVEFGCGIENFWNDSCFDYDIIHFMYCHLVLTKRRTIEDLILRLDEIKGSSRKIFIVASCHNLQPHYSLEKENVYDVVYKNCDQIYHFWNYSLEFGKQHYPEADNVMLEHPVYETIFTSFVEKSSAQKFLGLKKKKKYILCMGAFRDKEEREFLVEIARALRKEGFCILAPSFYHYIKRRNLIKMALKMVSYFCYMIYGKIRFPNIIFTGKHSGSFVPEEKFKYFYGASDLCFIQRLKILNSGNLFMAFYFAKPVCGPNVGNVGQVLEQFGNVTFDVGAPDSAIEAIRKTYELSKTGLGDKNRKYAIENWTTAKIGEKQYKYYKNLLEKV